MHTSKEELYVWQRRPFSLVAVDELASRHFPRYISKRYARTAGPLSHLEARPRRRPCVSVYAPRRVTSCYQFLAAERRAWKFMRDATHCFNDKGGEKDTPGVWKSQEAERRLIDPLLQRLQQSGFLPFVRKTKIRHHQVDWTFFFFFSR